MHGRRERRRVLGRRQGGSGEDLEDRRRPLLSSVLLTLSHSGHTLSSCRPHISPSPSTHLPPPPPPPPPFPLASICRWICKWMTFWFASEVGRVWGLAERGKARYPSYSLLFERSLETLGAKSQSVSSPQETRLSHPPHASSPSCLPHASDPAAAATLFRLSSSSSPQGSSSGRCPSEAR